MKKETLKKFFNGIEEQLQERQKDFQDAVGNFLVELAPRIQAAQELDQEMNRIFAHRFNVLDYLRDDEHGLSNIIADLLNPAASHGQGKLFLETFLGLLQKNQKSENCDIDSGWFFDSRNVKVRREMFIEESRRIDIYVEMKSKENTDCYCLAIENKPYTGDQERQIADYLKHLKRKYKDKFLLIYLSPRGQPPSEHSLPGSEHKQWEGRFKVMAYHGNPDILDIEGNESDACNYLDLASFSLTDWFKECRRNCEVDRLRSFLRDAEHFCEKKFGGSDMSNNIEQKIVEDVIFSNPKEFLDIAHIFYDVWPVIRNDICENFFNILCNKIKRKIRNSSSGLERGVKCCWHPKPSSNKRSLISFRNENWGSNIVVGLESDGLWKGYGAKDWFMGIKIDHVDHEKIFEDIRDKFSCSILVDIEEEFRQFIEGNFEEKDKDRKWPIWFWMEKDSKGNSRGNWYSLLTEIRKETQNGGGDITDYYVENFVRFVALAESISPIMSKFENEKKK